LDELDCDRPFSDGGGHSLDGSVPHVARCKDTRHARFEQRGRAIERPPVTATQIRAREQENRAGLSLSPRAAIRSWGGPNEHEERFGGDCPALSGSGVSEL
jgi:hypothetical protein